MEVNADGYVTLKLTASWLAMRLDFVGILIIAGTGALCIEVWGLRRDKGSLAVASAIPPPYIARPQATHCTRPHLAPVHTPQGGLDPSLAGLALLYALELTRYLKQCTNMASQSESNLTSVERIMEVWTRGWCGC
eukprot:363410-Chlamydomonas_euryale.AAC.5